MRSLFIVASLVLASVATGSAAAQTADDHADARCILVLQAVGGTPQQRTGAAQATFFFLGRMSSRSGTQKLPVLISTERQSFHNPGEVQAELYRCSQVFQKSAPDFQAASLALKAATPSK